MPLAQTKGEVTRTDVVELLHVTHLQAYRILQKPKDTRQLSLGEKAQVPSIAQQIGGTHACVKNARVRLAAFFLYVKNHPRYNLPKERLWSDFRHNIRKKWSYQGRVALV